MPVTIQTGANQFTKEDITKYSLMLGGLNVTHDVLKQYDPLVGGYHRIFMVRRPQHLVSYFGSEKTSRINTFKHILEYGNTGVSGIDGITVEFGPIQGGYSGKSFSIPTTAKDGTESFTIKVPEFSGSPMREVLYTWINSVSDVNSGLAHYNGLIASGELGYSQANHTAEFIYVLTDRTGMKVEYACMFCNCFPTAVPADHFNSDSPGTHDTVELSIEFNCTKYEGVDINEKAKILLKNYQIMTNSLEFFSGLDVKVLQQTKTAYNPKTGMLENLSGNKVGEGDTQATMRTNISNKDVGTGNTVTSQTLNKEDYTKVTPSYTDIGNFI